MIDFQLISLYSENLGGGNILPGTANKFGSGSPMKDPEVARRVTEQLRGRKGAKRTEEGKRNISIGEKRSWINADDRRKIVAEKVSYYMQHGGAEKLSKERKGIKFSEETKRKISENHADFRGDKHPLYGSRFIWITNGIENKRFNGGELEIPIGWRKGKIDNRNKK